MLVWGELGVACLYGDPSLRPPWGNGRSSLERLFFRRDIILHSLLSGVLVANEEGLPLARVAT